ncbi:MAG: MBL fold metallo-hydrolase [Candidatus Geothermarchaeales archaeon]
MEIPSSFKMITLPYPYIPEGVKAYLIDDDKPTLIDTGRGDAESLSALNQALVEHGSKVEDIEVVLNTHAHPDHFGGDFHVKQASGARILIHSLEAPVIKEPGFMLEKWKRAYSEAGLRWAPRRYLDLLGSLRGVEPDSILSDGDSVDLGSVSFTVIHTPGHSPGHLCFYDEDRRVLFSGDHVIGAGSVYVGGPDGDLPLYLTSLENLLKIKIDLILPAHGPPVRDPAGRIREILKHQREREELILRSIKEEPKDLKQVTEAVYAGESKFTPVLGRMATLERLRKLIRDGRLRTATHSGRTVFFPV